MRYSLSLILILLFSINAFSQKSRIDIDKIKKELTNQESAYYYDRILFRYKGLPKSLDSLEAQHLYYARNFQKDLVSTSDKAFEDVVTDLKNRNHKTVISKTIDLLKKDPTNLDLLMVMLQSLDVEKDYKNYSHYYSQFRVLTKAIMDSGDGKSEKTPFVVNSVGDEYILLNLLRWSANSIRSSKPTNGGVLDIWDDMGKKLYIKVIYNY